MIVYQSDKAGFLADVLTNNISDIIHTAYFTKLGRSTSKNEILAWQNSMMYMNTVLSDDDINGMIDALEHEINLLKNPL